MQSQRESDDRDQARQLRRGSRGPQAVEDHQGESPSTCRHKADCKLAGGKAVCIDCQVAGERLGLGVPGAAEFVVGQIVLAWDREKFDFVSATIKEMQPLEITVEYRDGMLCLLPYSQVRPMPEGDLADVGITSADVGSHMADEEARQRDADIQAGRAKGKFLGLTDEESAIAADFLGTLKSWWLSAPGSPPEAQSLGKLIGHAESFLRGITK